jgi:uncharacterized membrane protein
MTGGRIGRVLGETLWAVPVLCIAASLALCIATLTLDRHAPGLVPETLTGNAGAVQSNLSTIATSMVTLLTLVLTVMTVAVQLAMGQFSPRIVRSLLHDRSNRLSLGLFAAAAVFAIAAATNVDSTSGTVPSVTAATAYALTLASIVVLVLYVHRAGMALRVSGIIDLVGDELHTQIQGRYPHRVVEHRTAGDRTIPSPGYGNVVEIHHTALVHAAARRCCTLELVPMMGDYVPRNAPLLRVVDGTMPRDAADLIRHIRLADERTHLTDPAYGFRKLVDIALRSAGSDPTTSVQAIHRIHDCLRELVTRTLPNGHHTDDAGVVRLLTREMTWEGYVRLAFDELRQPASASPQIARRLRAALEDLRRLAPSERRAPLDRELRLLTDGVRSHAEDADDAAAALVGDMQGIGSGPDLAVGRDGSG